MPVLKMKNNFGNVVEVKKYPYCIRVTVKSKRARYGSDTSLLAQANMVARRTLFKNPDIHSERYGDIDMPATGQIVGRWAEITYLKGNK